MIRFFVALLFATTWQTAVRADGLAPWPRFSEQVTDTAGVIAGIMLTIGFIALGLRVARRMYR